MKILLIDIETSPNVAYVWGLFKENIPLARLIDSSYTLCWSAKWLGQRDVIFRSVHKNKPKEMITQIHALLDEADVVVHYYGSRFDIPTLNKEFLLHGLPPPSPYKQIDLCNVVRKQFKFVSNKLDYVAQQLGLGQKHETSFMLWIDCMANKAAAWAKMKRYNIQDVRLLEKLYNRLMPWIPKHPNHAAFEDGMVCPQCGGSHYVRRGFQLTNVNKYVRYQCRDCHKYFRGNHAIKSERKEKFVHVV